MVQVIHRNEPVRSGSSEDNQSFQVDMLHWRLANRPRVWRPPTDFYETEENFVVRVEVAGMQDTDFQVTLGQQHLQIHGVRADVSERRAYHQMEIPYGEFETDVELPAPVVFEQIDAVYLEGFLRIILPKARPHHVKIGE